MNFKNLSENLIIVIVSTIVGGGIGYFASTASNKQTIELLTPTIAEAIRKETTSINNKFETEIKKLKNRKGIVELDIKPILENHIEQLNESNQDSTKLQPETPKKEKRFLGIFKRRKKHK